MQEKTIEIDGKKITYFDEGTGFPSLLIHGWLGVKEAYSPFVNYLKNKHRLIILDLPNFGGSQKFRKEEPSLEEYVSFINRFVVEIGIDKFNLWGNSYGGVFAFLYAKKYPQKVSKIVLHAPVYFCKFLPKVFTNGPMKLFIRSTSAVPFLANLYARFIEWLFFKRGVARKMETDGVLSSEELSYILEKFTKTIDRKEARPIIRKLILDALEMDLCEVAKQLKQPTLVICNKKDPLTKYEGALYLKDNMPETQIISRERCHSLLLEDFGELSVSIDKFLRSS